jgi:hypothetical protein
LIATYRPRVLACEELYAHYRHPRTAILMGHARGVILAAAGRHGMAVLPLAATHVKKILTGSGRASKQQVQRAVANTLGLPALPGPHDVADAPSWACGVRTRSASAPTWLRRRGGTKASSPICWAGPPWPKRSPTPSPSPCAASGFRTAVPLASSQRRESVDDLPSYGPHPASAR